MPSLVGIMLVGTGGAVGTVLRYFLGVWLNRPGAWPWGTLLVNVVGSFALGIVAEALAERRIAGTDARAILGTGVLGGFTTYSAFNLETLALIERGDPSRALGYGAVTLVGCLLAGALGVYLGRWMR